MPLKKNKKAKPLRIKKKPTFRKHVGINPKTGKLMPGYKYSGKRTKRA